MGSRLLKDMTIKEQLEYQIQLSINGYDMVINKYDLELDAKKITMAQHYDLCKKANADITQDILWVIKRILPEIYTIKAHGTADGVLPDKNRTVLFHHDYDEQEYVLNVEKVEL